MRLLLGILLPLRLLSSSVNAIEPEATPSLMDEYNASVNERSRQTMLEEYRAIEDANRGNRAFGQDPERQWKRTHNGNISPISSNLLRSASPSAHQQSLTLEEQSTGQGVAPTHGGFGAYQRRMSHTEPNLSIGPLDLAFTWKGTLDYTDNYFHTEDNREDGLSLSAGFLTEGEWHISEDQTLSLNLGLGANYWLDAPEGEAHTGDLDLNVVPGSQLSYLIEVGETISIRFYDQLQIQRNRRRGQFSLDELSVSDQWSNAAGAQFRWAINERVALEAGYEIGQRRALDNQFDQLDYDWQTASLNLSVTDGGPLTLGLESVASWSDYELSSRSDAQSVAFGGYASWAPSDYTSVQMSMGIERWQFDASDTLSANSQNHFYGSLGISNQLNEDFRHTLSLGRNSSLSDFSNISQSNFIRYGFDWDVSSTTRLNGYLAYHRSEEVGEGRGERLSSPQAGLDIQQGLTDFVSIGIGGHGSKHHSNLDTRSYTELRGQAWITWHLNQAFTLTASYEHWRASGDAEFEENRLLIGTSLSF